MQGWRLRDLGCEGLEVREEGGDDLCRVTRNERREVSQSRDEEVEGWDERGPGKEDVQVRQSLRSTKKTRSVKTEQSD